MSGLSGVPSDPSQSRLMPQGPPQGPPLRVQSPVSGFDESFPAWMRGGEQPQEPFATDRQEADRQRRRQAEEALFMASWRIALREDPDTQAEAQRIARELGRPVELIERDMDTARELMKRRAVAYAEFAKQNPRLLEQLSDSRFAMIAHDDLDNLRATEGIGTRMGRAWDTGRMVNERGYLGVRKALGWLAPEEEERLAEIDLLRRDSEGFLANAAELAGQMVETTSLAAGAGAAAALPVAALSGPGAPATFGAVFLGAAAVQGGMIEGGNQYLDLLDQGIEPGRAATMAFGLYAPVAGALEAVGAKYFFAPLKGAAAKIGLRVGGHALGAATAGAAFRDFVTAYAKSVVAETVTEMGQEVAGIGTQELARAIDRPDLLPQTFGDAAAQVLGVGAKTAQGMALLGLPGPAVGFVAGMERAGVAAQRVDSFKKAVKRAQESKLAERAPEAYGGYVDNVVRDTPAENVYLDARMVAQVLDQLDLTTEDLAEVLPEAAAQLESQARAGGDVVIPMGSYLAKVVRDPTLHPAFEPHVRIDPDDPSASEIESAKPLVEKMLGDMQAALERETTDAQSGAVVEKSVLQQLGAAITEGQLGIDQSQRRTAAAVLRAFYEVAARRVGMTAEELYAAQRVDVSYSEASLEGAQQVDVNTPEFRNWFRESQVVDEQGKPLVVFHGTGAQQEFVTFDDMGEGVFFTSDPAEASGYARGERGRVFPVFLSLQNPKRIEGGGDWATERQEAIDEGHDGLIVDGNLYVSFFPEEQVKSATGNRGTFDPNDRSILNQIVTPSGEVSTRVPTGKKATEDPNAELLTTDYSTARGDPKAIASHAATLRTLPFLRQREGATDEEVVEAYIEHVVANLEWLFSKMPAEDRERSRLWYDGGRKFVERWADRYGLSAPQAAAIIAVLSPQKDWFVNMTMAERALDILTNANDHRWDAEMTTRANQRLRKIPRPKGYTQKQLKEQVYGKTLAEVRRTGNRVLAAYWLRVYDQAHNQASLRRLTPEGGAAGSAGQRIQWAPYGTIAKVVSLLDDSSGANISLQLGGQHKVRSFYNNLVSPNSRAGHVTIDTHAVAAAYLLPVASGHPYVTQAWGGKGGTTSRQTGLLGFYPLLAEAYRRAGAKHGLLPREMQSITWEQVRGLFSPAQKRTEARIEDEAARPSRQIWARYAAGEITQEQAQEAMLQQFGGDFDPLFWHDLEPATEPAHTYRGESAKATQARGDIGRKPDPVKVMVEAKPNTNPELLARWERLMPEQRAQATQEILDRVVREVLREVGVNGALEAQRGAWEGEPEASIAVVLEDPDVAVQVADMLGARLHQEGMFVVSLNAGRDLAPGQAVRVILPDGMTAAEIDALYKDVLWPIQGRDGKHAVIGHSTQGRHMLIGVDPDLAGLNASELATILEQKLDDTYAVGVLDLHAAFRTRKDHYGTPTPAQPSARGGSPAATRGGRDVGAATADAIYDAVLRRFEERGEAEGAEGRVAEAAGVLRQDVPPEFFSALQRAVEGMADKPLSAAGWHGALNSLVNVGSIKKEEVEWSGISEWLDLHQGKISKDDVLAFLRAHGVRVKVTVLGDPDTVARTDPATVNVEIRTLEDGSLQIDDNELGVTYRGEKADEGWNVLDEMSGEVIAYGLESPQAVEAFIRRTAADGVDEENLVTGQEGGTRWNRPDLVLPGGTNYREILVSLPLTTASRERLGGEPQDLSVEEAGAALRMRPEEFASGEPGARVLLYDEGGWIVRYQDGRYHVFAGREEFLGTSLKEAEDWLATHWPEVTREADAIFQSDHFGVPNLLVHLRVNDRVDENGDRVLFVEEIQSDWGQQGRKFGFQGDEPSEYVKLQQQQREVYRKANERRAELLKEKNLIDGEELLRSGLSYDEQQKMRSRIQRVIDADREWNDLMYEAHQLALAMAKVSGDKRNVIPSGPFVQSTQAWVTLGLKQLLIRAVEGGYDKVAFISGEEAAARYDMSKRIESIEVSRQDENDIGLVMMVAGGEADALRFEVDGNGTVMRAEDIPAAEGRTLGELIGEGLAAKIMATEVGDAPTLRGLDLQVGGAGMRDFYNKIVPNTARKLVKKLGGEVSRVSLQGVIAGTVQSQHKALRAWLYDELDRLPAALELMPAAQEIRIGRATTETVFRQTVDDLEDQLREIGREDLVPEMRSVVENATASPENRLDTSAIEVTDDLRASVEQGLPLFSRGTAGEARASIDLTRLAVMLHKKADVSSILHEFSHGFLQIYTRLVTQQLATPDQVGSRQMQDDVETVLDWFGIAPEAGSLREKLQVWNGMSLDEQRRHHEAFAYSFESYLFGERAPSMKLEGVFQRIGRWLRRIYRDVRDRLNKIYRAQFGEDLPSLTPEVRAVFDRMLAAEDDIARAEAVRQISPTFATKEEFLADGRTEEEWVSYQEALQDANDAAVMDLSRASLRQMKWLEGARSRALKELQKTGKIERDRIRAELAPEVARQPVHRLRRWLRTGRFVGPDGLEEQGEVDPNHKLRTADVQAMVLGGADTQQLGAWLSQDGQDPDTIADLFDFESGEAMVRALLEEPNLDDATTAAVDERMMAEFAEFVPGTPEHQEAIEEALHNDARARFVAVEMRFLSGATQPVRVMVAAARLAARRRLAGMRLRDIRPRDFAAAEARAAKEALEAAKAKSPAEAIDAKRRQLLQNVLAAEAVKIRAEVAKARREVRKFGKADKKLAKTRDVNLIAAGRAILAAYGLGGGPREAAPHLERVREYNPTLYQELAPMVARATEAADDYRKISLERFRDVMDAVEALWWHSKREHQIVVGGETVSREEAKARVLAQLAKHGVPESITTNKGRRAFGSIRAGLRHVESWAIEMDGGTPGDVHRFLFLPLRERFDTYQIEKQQRVRELHDRVHALKLSRQKIDAPTLGHTFNGKAELLGALLHSGNASNLMKNLLARGWGAMLPDKTLDASKWWEFVQEMADRGVITEADLEFVQWVWDRYAELLPRAQAAHFENYGYYFDRVQVQPFTVTVNGKAVHMRGGYVPAKADPDAVEARPDSEGDGVVETARDMRETHASTGKGFTVTRTNIIRPLAHDLRMHEVALDEELRFIHLQRTGRDIAGLLHDPELVDTLAKIDPSIRREMFFPWLRDTLQNRVMQPGLNPAITRVMVFLRRNTGAALMFANVRNALQQLTGLGSSAIFVRLPFLRAAAANYLRDRTMVQRITEASEFMRLRLRDQLGQIVDDIDVLSNPTWIGKAQDWTNRHAYFMQAWMQNPVDVITWAAARDQAIADGKTEAEAITFADSVVRRSQGSGTAADVSKFERGSPVVRVFMQFSTFWMSALNAVLAQPSGAGRVRAAGLLLGIVGVTAGAIAKALEGGWDDDDEDGALWDDVTGWAVGETLQTGASIGAPVVGPAVMRMLSGPSAGRLSFGATFGLLERAGRVLLSAQQFATDPERELKGGDVKDLAALLSLATGMPLTAPARPIAYATEVDRGKVEPSGLPDFLRGLLVGR